MQGRLALISSRTEAQQLALLDVARDGEYWWPTCASYGITLVRRESQSEGEGFWGCANFPRCRTHMQLRRATPRSRIRDLSRTLRRWLGISALGEQMSPID